MSEAPRQVERLTVDCPSCGGGEVCFTEGQSCPTCYGRATIAVKLPPSVSAQLRLAEAVMEFEFETGKYVGGCTSDAYQVAWVEYRDSLAAVAALTGRTE